MAQAPSLPPNAEAQLRHCTSLPEARVLLARLVNAGWLDEVLRTLVRPRLGGVLFPTDPRRILGDA